ncbi:MAG: dehydratase [Chloroflexi bacterium]|nr:dehydratase [Chloroflexota bacterium]
MALARGLYFEEFEVGAAYTSPGRTVTETDVVTFAALSGDYNQLHTDAEFAKSTFFGARIAHGLLGLSMASGLGSRMGFLEGTALAFLSLTWKFSKPIFIGDTIALQAKVAKKRAVSDEAGIVVFDCTLLNQRDEVTQQGEWTVMVKRKAGEG